MAHAELPLPILDVRSGEAFHCGHVAGSVNIPLAELAGRMYELPEKGVELGVLHDDVMMRECAMKMLRERGYVVREVSDGALDERGPSLARLWSPTPLLVEALSLGRWLSAEERAKGRTTYEAADLGCGSGREAVYLAMLGWRVDGFDVLPDALENARRLAARCGVTLSTIQRNLRREPSLGDQRYDLVCMFRFWDEALLAAAIQALRSDGLIAVEAFADGDQKRATRLVTADRLADHARGLDVLISRDKGRSGRRFTQLIARRR